MVVIKKNGQKAWVTFSYTPVHKIENISVSGEWNEWKAEPMKLNRNGIYSLTKILKTESTFEFGYKLNGKEWITEAQCPSITSPFSTQNSLLEL
jgi:hypothetical protein